MLWSITAQNPWWADKCRQGRRPPNPGSAWSSYWGWGLSPKCQRPVIVHLSAGNGEAAFRQRAWAVEKQVSEKGPQGGPDWMHTGSRGDPPQNIHRPQLTDGLLNWAPVWKKGNSIPSHTSSPSSPTYSNLPPSHLLLAVSPLLSWLLFPCCVFNKLQSPLFCLRWILSPSTPLASTQTRWPHKQYLMSSKIRFRNTRFVKY